MNKQTWKQYKKTHPKATLEEWLNLHVDKRKASIPKHKYPKDKVTRLYAGKDRGLVRKQHKQPEEVKAVVVPKKKRKAKRDHITKLYADKKKF